MLKRGRLSQIPHSVQCQFLIAVCQRIEIAYDGDVSHGDGRLCACEQRYAKLMARVEVPVIEIMQ